MEWFTTITPSLSGLPWWAVFVVVLVTIGLTKGVPALLKYLGFGFEREKYRDGLRKAERDALVEELRKRVDKLESLVDKTTGELNKAREAHSKCEIEQAKLQGKLDAQSERMNHMQTQINSLMKHDIANAQNTKHLAAIVKEETGKAPTIDQVP
jgi:predicted nuclease with TOPRIM domain